MDRLPPPFNYETLHAVVKYSTFQKRLEMRKKLIDLNSREGIKFGDTAPFFFSEIQINKNYDGSVTVVFDSNDRVKEKKHKKPHLSFVFTGNTITVQKFNVAEECVAQREHVRHGNQNENLKHFLEFYLDREGTCIKQAHFEMFPDNVLFKKKKKIQFNTVTLEEDAINTTSFFKMTTESFCQLQIPYLERSFLEFSCIRSANLISIGNIRSSRDLENILRLRTKAIHIDSILEVSDSDVAHFLKTFAELDSPIHTYLHISGTPTDMERLFNRMRDQNNHGWRNTHYYRRENLTLAKSDREVNINVLGTGTLSLTVSILGVAKCGEGPIKPNHLARSVFRHLSYENREKIINEAPGIVAVCQPMPPIRAQSLFVKYRNEKMVEARVDNYQVTRLFDLEVATYTGCFVDKLHIQGLPPTHHFPSIETKTLVLEMEEAVPEFFQEAFSNGLPDTIIASSDETIKNIRQMATQCTVIIQPSPKMPLNLAQRVFSHLPYSARDGIVDTNGDDMNFSIAPLRAEKLEVNYFYRKLQRATVDGHFVKSVKHLEIALKAGCFVKKMLIEGHPGQDAFTTINAEHLTLLSSRPFPEYLTRFFSNGLPKTIITNNAKIIENIQGITNECAVTFMDEETGEPSAKRARTSD